MSDDYERGPGRGYDPYLRSSRSASSERPRASRRVDSSRGSEPGRERGRERRPRPRRERANRLPAFIVLVIMVVVLIVAGVMGRPSDPAATGTGTGVPFKVLPITPAFLGAEAATSVMTTAEDGGDTTEAAAGSQ